MSNEGCTTIKLRGYEENPKIWPVILLESWPRFCWKDIGMCSVVTLVGIWVGQRGWGVKFPVFLNEVLVFAITVQSEKIKIGKKCNYIHSTQLRAKLMSFN